MQAAEQIAEHAVVLPAMEAPPKILIVDDRRENLLATEKILRKLNAGVFVANSGNEALALVLRHRFALVLLDVQMPGMDGFETAMLMQEHESMQGVPIIFVTAISKEEKYATQAAEIGAVDYIFKPINPEILRSKVKELYPSPRRTLCSTRAHYQAQRRSPAVERGTGTIRVYLFARPAGTGPHDEQLCRDSLDEAYGGILDEKGRKYPALHHRKRPAHAGDDFADSCIFARGARRR